MECSNQRGEAKKLTETFHLSPSENILSIAQINSLFVLYDTKIDH